MNPKHLPAFRLRPGESSESYILRMRHLYGPSWYLIPICCVTGCNRAPVLRVIMRGSSLPIYYCKAHKARAEEYRTAALGRYSVEPFRCPPRTPGKEFRL